LNKININLILIDKMKAQIEKAILKTIEKRQIINIRNVVLNSLFISGGTLAGKEHEIKKYLDANLFEFKHGFFLFFESTEKVCLNYTKPLKIKNSLDYTYKVLKNQIQAKNGFNGLREYIKSNSKVENTFYYTNSFLLLNYQNQQQ
jgi:hypothetical protein